MLHKHLSYLYLIIALLFSSLPYLVRGYPFGDDSLNSLIRVNEYQLALANLQLPPYWAENLYGGYGSPIFIFYAPLFMFIASIFYFLTGSIIWGNIGAILFFTVIGIYGIYLLLQEMLGEKTPVNQCAARIASYFFILNPYLFGDKFIRVSNSEYTALCLAPISLYGLTRIKRDPLMGSLILAAGLTLAILAHNLTALSITVMLIVLSPVLYWDNARKIIWQFTLGGIILGLLMAAFFWMPAIYYKSFINIEQLTQGHFNFHNNFKPLSEIINTSGFISIGILNLLTIILSISLLRSKGPKINSPSIKLAKSYLMLAFLFILLQTKLSLPLWENISYLALFQFPWRMMGPLALINAVLSGLLFPLYCKKNNISSFKKLELTLLCLCIVNTMPIFSLMLPLSTLSTLTEPQINELSSIHQVSINKIKYLSSRFEKNKIIINDIKTVILSSTSVDEYLPKSTKIKLKHFANEYDSLILKNTPDSNIVIIKDTGTEIILETNAQQSTQLELKRWFFPGWEYRVNGVEQHVEKSDSGLIAVKIPPGHHYIDIKLKPPFLRQLFTWVSFTALALWTILVIKSISRNSQPLKPENSVIY